jgi:drug/metabolite transporter (DMT)-like permease
VLSKVTFRAGGGVLTVSTLRGVIGLVALLAWLQLTRRSAGMARQEMAIALGLGIVFAANVFLLFLAIEAIAVPIAILTYFVYPMLTGIAAALIGIEKLSWRGAVAAIVAFLGLGLMLGAQPGDLVLIGILGALGAALCRVALLLVTRATLQRADALAITLYSTLSSTVLFLIASLLLRDWQPPVTATGLIALVGLGIFVTTGILGVFASTARIGAFRTALFMNLEPLLTAIGSALFLGEIITPLQALGGTVMIAALTLFQLRR